MKLSFNMNSFKTLRTYKKNIDAHSKNINNISTGKKINSAKDNPNRISSLGNFEREIRGQQASRRNVQDSVSMIQSADSVMDSVTNRISRIRELAVGLGSASMSDDEKAIVQNEINTLIDGMDYEVKNFSFNGTNIIGDEKVTDNSKNNTIQFLSTGNAGEFSEIPVYNLTSEGLGLDGLDVMNSDIDSILGTLDNAMSQVLGARSKLGAIQNNFEDKVNQSESLEETLVGAKSKIEDADIAEEMIELTKNLILTEANIKNMNKTIYMPEEMVSIIGKLYK